MLNWVKRHKRKLFITGTLLSLGYAGYRALRALSEFAVPRAAPPPRPWTLEELHRMRDECVRVPSAADIKALGSKEARRHALHEKVTQTLAREAMGLYMLALYDCGKHLEPAALGAFAQAVTLAVTQTMMEQHLGLTSACDEVVFRRFWGGLRHTLEQDEKIEEHHKRALEQRHAGFLQQACLRIDKKMPFARAVPLTIGAGDAPFS